MILTEEKCAKMVLLNIVLSRPRPKQCGTTTFKGNILKNILSKKQMKYKNYFVYNVIK